MAGQEAAKALCMGNLLFIDRNFNDRPDNFEELKLTFNILRMTLWSDRDLEKILIDRCSGSLSAEEIEALNSKIRLRTRALKDLESIRLMRVEMDKILDGTTAVTKEEVKAEMFSAALRGWLSKHVKDYEF